MLLVASAPWNWCSAQGSNQWQANGGGDQYLITAPPLFTAAPNSVTIGTAPNGASALVVEGGQMFTPTGEVFRTDAPNGTNTSWRLFRGGTNYGRVFNLNTDAHFRLDASAGDLRFHTNGLDRGRFNQTLTGQLINGFPGLDLSGFLGVGNFTGAYSNASARVHVDNASTLTLGYRDVIKKGFLATRGEALYYGGILDGSNSGVLWSYLTGSSGTPGSFKFIYTGDNQVLGTVASGAPGLELGFVGGVNFLAIPDPNTCLDDCEACCDDWGGFTVDTYDPDEDGVYELINVFSPNGDGVNDYWMVMDQDHPYCAYGAQSFELFIWSPGSAPVWYLQSSPDGCCPFESRAPNNPIAHSSIYWDGTINTGYWNCYGCQAATTSYSYVLHLWGCEGSVTYTGDFMLLRSMVNAGGGGIQSSATSEVLSAAQEAETRADLSEVVPELMLFPNPSSESATLACPGGMVNLTVCDLLGRRVHTELLLGRATHTVSIGNWASGDYVFRVERRDGLVEFRKFLKQ